LYPGAGAEDSWTQYTTALPRQRSLGFVNTVKAFAQHLPAASLPSTVNSASAAAGGGSSSSAAPAEATTGLPRESTNASQQSYPYTPPVETFLCPLCVERDALEQRFSLGACGEEAHAICRRCAFRYIDGRVREMRVDGFRCPMGLGLGACGSKGEVAAFSEEELLLLLGDGDEDALAAQRYRQFKRMRADRSLRPCPGCEHLCKPELDEDEQVIPAMTCPSCQAEFCYYHSWAHRGADCTAYAAQMQEEEAAIKVAFDTKECPSCGWRTEKSGGCNHMTCQHCQADWCWICGEVIQGSISWHYSPQNAESGCMQFSNWGHPSREEVMEMRRRMRQILPECQRPGISCLVEWGQAFAMLWVLFIHSIVGMLVCCTFLFPIILAISCVWASAFCATRLKVGLWAREGADSLCDTVFPYLWMLPTFIVLLVAVLLAVVSFAAVWWPFSLLVWLLFGRCHIRSAYALLMVPIVGNTAFYVRLEASL